MRQKHLLPVKLSFSFISFLRVSQETWIRLNCITSKEGTLEPLLCLHIVMREATQVATGWVEDLNLSNNEIYNADFLSFQTETFGPFHTLNGSFKMGNLKVIRHFSDLRCSD